MYRALNVVREEMRDAYREMQTAWGLSALGSGGMIAVASIIAIRGGFSRGVAGVIVVWAALLVVSVWRCVRARARRKGLE